MEQPRMRLFGGPHDGRELPIAEVGKVNRLLVMVDEPDPTHKVVYEIRLSALEAEQQDVIYDFVGTLIATIE